MKLNVLIAYPYCNPPALRQLQRLPPGSYRFLLDSGAFTAWNAGRQIDLDDYCRFIESLPIKPWRYFVLDVIGDPVATRRNYDRMLQRGFTPIPIYTPGESTSAIDEFYKTSDVVGFGGINGFKGSKRKAYVNGVMNHVGNRKAHWLGFVDINYIKAYKPYMCDSSSWDSGSMYGSLSVYIGGGKSLAVKKKDFIGQPSAAICNAIRYYNINPHLLKNPRAWRGGYGEARKIGSRSGVRLTLDVEKNTGTKQFLAAGSSLPGFIHVVNYYLELLKR